MLTDASGGRLRRKRPDACHRAVLVKVRLWWRCLTMNNRRVSFRWRMPVCWSASTTNGDVPRWDARRTATARTHGQWRRMSNDVLSPWGANDSRGRFKVSGGSV